MRFSFVSRRFYNSIGFGGRALPAPVAELGRWGYMQMNENRLDIAFFAAAILTTFVFAAAIQFRLGRQLEAAPAQFKAGLLGRRAFRLVAVFPGSESVLS